MPPNRSPYQNITKLVFAILPTLSNAIPVQFHPIKRLLSSSEEPHVLKTMPLTESEFYLYAITSTCLVLLGGIFAGLTIGLMGQDEVYLKVIASSGTPSERRCAKKVLQLLDRGKHWLLVTLLLSNVITNESLPVILDRLLGGGFAAVFSSTAAIVIFGEIIPQSICVRYGLELGAFFAPYVLILMYFMYPIAYPIAKLLDYILGQNHGTLYRKSGLKTLVTLHHTMGTERLNLDEVTIISAVLDLKAKPVSKIMTPINKIYTLPSNRILDEKTIEEIFNAGFSRIPIHFPGEPTNFVGMLLVRILISYDPEDELPISSFPLATLPETSLNTSCLNILNYFQEGKSHMVVVSETPGNDNGAVGILTLEDVIEELIGEEIVDETDVYIDVNKNIKRQNPGPFAKRNVTSYLHKLYRTASKHSTNDDSTQVQHENSSSSLPDNLYISKDSYINNTKNGSIPNVRLRNSAIDPIKTSNSHITIKKQPALSSPPIKPMSRVQNIINERDSLCPSIEVTEDYGSNNDVSKDKPVIHNSEAAAFVQGVYENATRHSSKCPDPNDCVGVDKQNNNSWDIAKKNFIGNSMGIPVPRDLSNNPDSDDSVDNSYNSHSGILVEDNIVSLKGVSKTIIHDGTWKTNY